MGVVCRLLATYILVLSIGGASAHPHVWVTMRCKIIFDDSGLVTGLLHSWSFDEMTSAFAVMGKKSKNDVFTREELAVSAREQIVALSRQGFFTTLRVGDARHQLGNASDYWLEFDGKLLTLHFLLPTNPALAPAALMVEIYDASYFVDLRFADDNPVEMTRAPTGA